MEQLDFFKSIRDKIYGENGWRYKHCDNRVQSLIEYFCKCIKKDKDNPVILEHINNIFAYEKNFKKFFKGGKVSDYGGSKWYLSDGNIDDDNGLTAKVFAIAIELLTSDNIYKDVYYRNQEGLIQLKEVLSHIYHCKEYGRSEATNLSVDPAIEDILDISNKEEKYGVEDFLREYDNLFKWDVTTLEYRSSLISEKLYDETIEKKFERIFDKKIIEDNVEKSIDYAEMYNEEKFDFLMNFILCSYEISLDINLFGIHKYHILHKSATESLHTKFGHQVKHEKKEISDEIIMAFATEKGYLETGSPHTLSSRGNGALDEEANYALYAYTNNQRYELYGILAMLDPMYNGARANFEYDYITEYGFNLTEEQVFKILDLIENMIFNENGYLNIQDGSNCYGFICSIYMFELFNKALKKSEFCWEVYRRLHALVDKIRTANINYLEKYDDIKHYRDYCPFMEIYDSFSNVCLGSISKSIEAALKERYIDFYKTRQKIKDQLKKNKNTDKVKKISDSGGHIKQKIKRY